MNFRWGLLRALQQDGHSILILTPDGPEKETFLSAGMKFIPLKNLSRKGTNPLNDILLARELTKIYREEKIDITLNYTIKPVIYGSLAAHRAEVFSINTITGLGYSFLSKGVVNKIARFLYKQALQKADVTLFQNPDDRQHFIEEQLVTVQNSDIVHGSGVNPRIFLQSPLSEATPQRFLFIGRLLNDKGIREYVEAAEMVKAKYPAASFHVLGGLDNHNPSAISQQEIDHWVNKNIIVYHGSKSDVKPYIADANFVVLPSYREGLPRVMLEAAAMGRPLIASDVPGCREIVRPELNGWLVPVKNSKALAYSMCGALETPTSALMEMASAGRKLVEDKFSEDHIIKHYKTIIEEHFPARNLLEV